MKKEKTDLPRGNRFVAGGVMCLPRAVFLVSVFLLGLAGYARAQTPSPTDLDWLRGECGDGALSYQSEGKIYLTELSSGGTVLVGNGDLPEFSPDSSKLAWIDGTTAKGRMRKGDATVHTIATGVTLEGGVHWISNTEVVVVRSAKWRRTSLAGGDAELPALTALGAGGNECDVKLGADGFWSYVTGATWKTSAGGTGATGGSCSSSLSPDGKSVTGLLDGHKECVLTRIRSGGVSSKLQWVYDFTGEKGFDNHRWSSNDGRFVACQDEKYNTIVVMKVGGTYCTRMGNQGSGEMYGDFTVGDGQGEPWPGTVVEPLLDLAPASLSFAGLVGGNRPPAQTVSVTNSGGGTLNNVTTAIAYGKGSGWLDATRGGTGNNQSLSNSVNLVGLGAGSYTATVTVSCGNAANSPRTYSVALDLKEEAELTTIEVQPRSVTIMEGQTVDFRAYPRDQGQKPFPAVIAWSATAGGSLTPATSSEPVTEHVSTFTSDGTPGIFEIAASSGTVRGTASVTVESKSTLHLRINCGDNQLTPTGWENDDDFVRGGADFVFSETFDVAGVLKAAPAEVYRSCRHRVRGVETSFGYDFADLPDGSYLVRLHFGDAYGRRSIDVWFEEVEVITDLDIVTAALGKCRALVKEIPVVVGGGGGLQILLTDDRSEPEDFFINGIEILGEEAGSNQPPAVDAGLDQTLGMGVPAFLDGTVKDDGLPFGTLTTSWSAVSGPAAVQFSDEKDPKATASFPVTGEFLLRLSADDGELQAHDDVLILVTEKPAITLVSPNGGEVLVAGTIHAIQWTTVNLDDVQIDFSIDGGGSFENITGSVDRNDPRWGSYQWTVPNTPSKRCLVKIAGYFGEAPTTSAASFEIRSGASGLKGGCGCSASADLLSGWGLILILLALGRRHRNHSGT